MTPPTADGRASIPPEGEASLSDLFGRLADDVRRLLRQEIELAKTEVRQEASAVGKASALLVAAGVLGLVTLLLLAWAASWALAALMPAGWAFLAVGVVVGAVAAVLGVMGRKRLRTVDLTPHATIETLQQDRQVMSERTTR